MAAESSVAWGQIASAAIGNSFAAFVAFWFMYRTNGKFDRLAKALNALTRVSILGLQKDGCIDEATAQQLFREVADI